MSTNHSRGALILALFLPLLVSCGPSVFTMSVDMRQPSSSGLDLAGKSMAIVFLDHGGVADSVFMASMADGFAQSLETEYFEGNRAINLYCMKADDSANYADKDTLVSLVIDSESDVVMLMDGPEMGNPIYTEPQTSGLLQEDSLYVRKVVVPFHVAIHAYDALSAKDKVLSFTGTNRLTGNLYTATNMLDTDCNAQALTAVAGEPAMLAGSKAASSFLSNWHEENYSVIYYDSSTDWVAAAALAYKYQWKDAIDLWLKLLDTKNLEKRSCAEYNIALACYMLNKSSLALEWLDRSDVDRPLSVSSDLRKKLQERMSR